MFLGAGLPFDVAFEKPLPARLTLIRLRSQERLYRSIRRTIEDARNATIQRIRALIPRLEELKSRISEEVSKIAVNLKVAAAKMSIEELGKLSELVKPTVTVEIVERHFEGVRFRGIDVRGVTSPNYSIYGTPPELDAAIHGLAQNLGLIVEMANLETLFYTLLARVREYQRMVNAIDNVILPRIWESMSKVSLALDEIEREEFVRRIIISRLLAQ